jgi:hypothetical protein
MMGWWPMLLLRRRRHAGLKSMWLWWVLLRLLHGTTAGIVLRGSHKLMGGHTIGRNAHGRWRPETLIFGRCFRLLATVSIGYGCRGAICFSIRCQGSFWPRSRGG